MSGSVEERLEALGLSLPAPAAPIASYVPFTVTGGLVFISGQLPMGTDGPQFRGKLGEALSVEDGQKAARLAALHVLAQLKAACDGDLGRVTRCLKLGGFVNAAPGFSAHAQVMNGASDLIVEVFGARGRHARFAAGASSLPLDAAVEIEAVFEVR
jgi:enamine deaminase RidA (YjgF/YER057c/UK114 family)